MHPPFFSAFKVLPGLGNNFEKGCSLRQVHRVCNVNPALYFENNLLAGHNYSLRLSSGVDLFLRQF